MLQVATYKQSFQKRLSISSVVQYWLNYFKFQLENMSLNLVEESKNFYYEIFNSHPQVVAYAPGRVNLIGEHIDYNNGFVLPIVSNSLLF